MKNSLLKSLIIISVIISLSLLDALEIKAQIEPKEFKETIKELAEDNEWKIAEKSTNLCVYVMIPTSYDFDYPIFVSHYTDPYEEYVKNVQFQIWSAGTMNELSIETVIQICVLCLAYNSVSDFGFYGVDGKSGRLTFTSIYDIEELSEENFKTICEKLINQVIRINNYIDQLINQEKDIAKRGLKFKGKSSGKDATQKILENIEKLLKENMHQPLEVPLPNPDNK